MTVNGVLLALVMEWVGLFCDRFSAEFPEGTVVELRKFPSFTDTSSVAEFFDGLEIVP